MKKIITVLGMVVTTAIVYSSLDEKNKKKIKSIFKKCGTKGLEIASGALILASYYTYIIRKCESSDLDYYDDNLILPDEICDNQISTQREVPRRFIGGIEVSGSRFRENEKQFLEEFSAQRDRFNGIEILSEATYPIWSSDGKSTRRIYSKHSFENDKIGITVDSGYEDDDGQSGDGIRILESGREIIDYVRGTKNLPEYDNVRDIVDVL